MRPHSRFIALAGSALVAGALGACAEQPRYSDYHPTPGYTSQPAPGYTTYPNQQGTEYGTVAYIEGLQARNRTSGAGAILGAVVGGVQVGCAVGRLEVVREGDALGPDGGQFLAALGHQFVGVDLRLCGNSFCRGGVLGRGHGVGVILTGRADAEPDIV